MRDNRIILTESQLREVIAQATREQERRRDGISIETLREIAAELDIDPVALEIALDQVIGLPLANKPVRSWFKRHLARCSAFLSELLPRRARAEAALVLGSAFGWLSGSATVSRQHAANGITYSTGSGVAIDSAVAIVMIVTTLVNSLAHRQDRNYRRYMLETVMMWLGFAATWALTVHGPTWDLVTWTSLCIAASAIWGRFVLRPISRSTRTPGKSMQGTAVEGQISANSRQTSAADGQLPGAELRWIASLRLISSLHCSVIHNRNLHVDVGWPGYSTGGRR